jgi:hypothetical protein
VPHIDWRRLPPAVRAHLEDRVRTRDLTARDLARLMSWVSSNPQVPDGPWCKDFGSFKLAGEGGFPKTFLTKDQTCHGEKIG